MEFIKGEHKRSIMCNIFNNMIKEYLKKKSELKKDEEVGIDIYTEKHGSNRL